MVAKKPKRTGAIELAGYQRETNRRLGRIEKKLETSSKVFELMDGRLENLEEGQNVTNGRLENLEEGQKALIEVQKSSVRLFELMDGRLENLEEGQKLLVEGQKLLVEGQNQVVARLDRLVEVVVRDRTDWAVRFDSLEQRVAALEQDRDPH